MSKCKSERKRTCINKVPSDKPSMGKDGDDMQVLQDSKHKEQNNNTVKSVHYNSTVY